MSVTFMTNEDKAAIEEQLTSLNEENALFSTELGIQLKPSKNLNVSPYFDKETKGVTFTVNADNSVTLSGTATGNAYAFSGVTENIPARFILPAGTYTLSGSYSNRIQGYVCLYDGADSVTLIAEHKDAGTGITFTTDTDLYCVVQIIVWAGYSTDGITLKMQLETGATSTEYVSPWSDELHSKRIADIETAVSELDAIVNALAVPNYYFLGGYLPGKVARINELMRSCSNNGDVFAFITDTHWEKNAGKSPALLNYIRQHTHIDRLFGGGDYIDGANSDTEMYDVSTIFRDAWAGPRYFTLGNHDYTGDAAYRETDASLYYIWNSYGTERVGNLSRNYYYVDNQQMKMRYIVLNRYIDRGEENAEINGLNEEQRTWLQNVALDVEPEWTVLVFVHDLYRFIYNEDGYTSRMLLSYSDSAATVTILDAFVEGGGTVAGIICGEAHVDMVNYTPGGIPVITTTCDKNTGTEAALPIADQFAARPSGTIKEQVIDVMVVDKTNRTITAVRIGYQARNSVEGSYGELVEERTITY